MINVSDAFKEELNNGNRVYLTYATITLTDGTRLTITNEQIWSSGVKIEESVSDSSSFSIGSAIASKLTLTLNNGYGDFTDYIFDNASVNIQVGLELPNGTIERVNKGYYIVTEATGQNTSLVTLECLDYMYKFNKPYSEVETVYPSTMGSIIRDICTHCGVTLTTTTFPRYDFLINERPNDEALSCLDVVSYISQIACCFARMNNSGQLMITWYDTNDVVVPEKLITKANGDYVTTKSGDYIVVLTTASDEDIRDGSGIVTKIHRIQHTGSHTIQLDDVVITGVRVSIKRDDDTVTALAGSEGYVLGVEENPFIQEGFEGTIADLIGERCIGMKFRPLSVTTLSDPTIEAGDRMYFISPIDNAVYISYITSNKFAISDWQEIKCDAETPARNSATKYGAATKSFVALRKMVQNEKTSRELALEELSTKVDNASGLYMTAEEQPDGSFIYYQHDKPTIAESSIIWKETAETRTVSTDGGQTWNAGITADGDAIVRLLQAEGINADWINAGTLVIRDNNNNIIFSASKESSTSGGSVFIGAGSVIIGGYNQVQSQSMSDALDSVKDYSDTQLTAYSQQVTEAIDDIQAQLDGQIESWYYNYDPTLSNAPASSWTTEELKQEHEGDTFTNTETGNAWRFIKDNDAWIWKAIADTAAAAALLAAQKAQQTADNKIRNFITVPVPPYDEGDFWIKNDGTILICTNGKESGQAYSANDWEEKVKYTDDTVANRALEEARRAQALNVVLSNEYDSIPTDADGNYNTFPTGIQTTVQTFLGHTDITSQCTYTVTKSSAISGSWNSGTKTYTVTGLLSDNGWVDISATYLGSLTATKRFTIAKVKQGVQGIQGTAGAKGDKGDPGESGRVYILEPSTAVISRTAMGAITPDVIVWKAYYRDGDEARQPYAGRFKIEDSEDGDTWTAVYTSTQNETSCSYASRQQLITKANGDKLVTKANGDRIVGPHVLSSMVRCTLYQAGGVLTVLDQQSTPIVDDTAGLTVILSNEAVSITADSTGQIPDYSECFTDLQVYYGNNDVTEYASYSTPVVSFGLVGTWDEVAKRYKITRLTPNDGYVDFTVSYKGTNVTRRFTISKSKNGLSMTGTTELYALNNSSTTAPEDSAFTEGIKAPTSSNRYLWNMERIHYSDNTYQAVDKHIVAMYGETGETGEAGIGIQNIENYYAISNSTTAPDDIVFDTNVKIATSSKRYLWNYEVTVYSNGTRQRTDKRIIGTYGEKGDKGDSGLPGRVYIVESSASVITKDEKGNTSPNAIEFNAYCRDGDSARVSYSGKFKIESSTDGNSWTTVYTSSTNESSCRYVLRHQLVTRKNKDKLVTKRLGDYITGPHVNGTMFRCTLIQAGSTSVALDQQTIPVIEKSSGLTVVLSNETVSVTAETDGTIPDYRECFTDVQVFNGGVDVTGLATYSVTKSSGLTGTWDGSNHRYSVSKLDTDDGYVDFAISYKDINVNRRFTISKSKDGVWQNSVVELYALNNDASVPPDDGAFSEGIKTPTATNRFLWNKERLVYSNGGSMSLEKHLVAMYGETGNGISSVTEYYAISSSTTAPADNDFSTTVQTPTAINKYLWNYEVIEYTDGTSKKTSKHIIGTYGDKGDSATRYYLEFTSKTFKIGNNGAYSPSSITVSLKQVTGNSGTSSAFEGRLKIVEWKNGVPTVRRTERDPSITMIDFIPSQSNIDYIKFEMYNYVNREYKILDQETVQCIVDFEALSQEDIFDVLTNNGEWEGIYKYQDDYYINFSYAKGGEMALGGLDNVNGSLTMYDADNQLIGSWTYAGLNITKGSISLGKDEDNNPITTISNNGVITTSQLNATAGTFGDLSLSDSSIRYNSPKVPTSISDHKLYIGKHGFSEEGFDESYVESTHYEYYRRVEIKDGFFAIYARTKSSSSTEKELIRISGGYEDYPKFEIKINDYNTSDTDNPTFLEGNYQDLLCTFGNLTFKSETRMSGWHGIKVRSPLRCFSTLSLSGLPTGTTGGYLRITKTDLDPESYSEAFQISYSSSSSKRYKNVGRLLTNNDIEKAYNVEVRMAKYKKGYLSEDDERCGKQFPMFIAEQMEEFLPDAVDHNSNGLAETWNDRVIIPIMFQMLKSQKEEIEELKKQINHLN